MTKDTAEQNLLTFVVDRNRENTALSIDLDTDLRDSGAIDSMGFVGLMALLEDMGAPNMDDVLARSDRIRTIRELASAAFVAAS